jgi:hypothetical protein
VKSMTAWPGLMPTVRRFFFRGAHPPKAKRYGETSTPTTSTYYEGMPKDYRWFRQDELVRKCIVTNTYFATMTAGFETVLEPTRDDVDIEDYSFVKERIDEFNKRVNMDLILFVAQIKRSIYGKSGFEIVLDDDETPAWLLSLQSSKLKPNVSKDWELTGFRYEGREGFYQPEEVLYFVNLSLEADHEGLSDVEPVRDICQARHDLLRENFPEIVRTIWAPYVILKAHTEGLSKEEADKVIDSLAEVARAGKSIAVNESVESTVVDLTPDIKGLNELLDKLEQAIIGNFGTPRFLLGKPIENRATAYAELEAYVQGPITHIQRYYKREVERQWYDRWTLKILEDEGKAVSEEEDPPVQVKHRWNPIRVTDVYEMAKAVALLWSRGDGAIGGRLEKAWEMMGWDKSELEEEE